MPQNVSTSKRSVRVVENPIQAAKRRVRLAALICAVGITLWLGMRVARIMADQILLGIITGRVR